MTQCSGRFRPTSGLVRLTRFVALATTLAVVATLLSGRGSENSANDHVKPATSEPSAETTAVTASAGSTGDEPDIAAAEDAVRDSLPDIPLWEGTKFHGVVVSDTKICVDRTVKKENVIGDTGRTSHVVVTWPDLDQGEPQDGPCADADKTKAKEAAAKRRFFLRMDDLAISLDDAISAAQNGESGPLHRLKSLNRKIHKVNDDYLLDGGTSVGANLLASASTAAVDAAAENDVAEMARQRKEVAEARSNLADEVTE